MTTPKRYWETADFWRDAAERVVSTYLFAFSGIVFVEGFDWSDAKVWKAAAVAAGLSTLKALIGTLRPKSTTPVSIV